MLIASERSQEERNPPLTRGQRRKQLLPRGFGDEIRVEIEVELLGGAEDKRTLKVLESSEVEAWSSRSAFLGKRKSRERIFSAHSSCLN